MKELILTLVLLGIICPSFTEKDWWENVQLYQIYPRSYMDSDGDGIGDLKGIIMKMDHLKDAGIQAAWLSPIFVSPMVDFGYDITDFRKIQPEYGTMKDFEDLTEKARKLGIKIVLDYVPNHSSDEHEWFKLSANRTEGYEDYYLWDDGKPDPKNASKRIPPNNWNSMFRGSAWTWNEERGQFYFHQFHAKQPDLNFRSPKVVQEMKDILTFWLDKGAEGFRVDAIPHLFETDRNSHGGVYPDEPLSGYHNDSDDYSYLNHIYTRNQPENIDMVIQWRQTLDEYQREHGGDTRVMMIEAYTEVEVTMQYFGNETNAGAHFPFNFNFITELYMDITAFKIKKAIDLWVDNIPDYVPNSLANWVIGNHDNRRVTSRYGEKRTDGLTMLVQLLPGIGVTYQGDEIAMEDQWLSWEETVDPQACNTNPKDYEPRSRDPERTPFQWDDTKNAGFSSADKTWLPVAKNYKTLNLKAQKEQPESHYKVYQAVSKLRREKTFTDGTLNVAAITKDVLAFKRELSGHDTYVVVINLSDKDHIVDLKQLKNLSPRMTIEVTNVAASYRKGEEIDSNFLYLEPYDSLVLKEVKNTFYYEFDYDELQF